MHSSALLHVLTAGLLAGFGLASAAQHSRRDVVCYFEVAAEAGETCEVMASSWGIDVDTFINLNPGVACPNLEAGKEYCVIGDYTPGEGTTTTTTPQAPPTTTTVRPTTTTQPTTILTSTTTSAPGPSVSPIMPGAAANCDRYYKIASGDSCDTVAQKNSITVAQLRSWNTEINASCSNLWLDYYVCTRVPGAAPPPATTTSTTTAPGPSVSPVMPGAAANCNRYYKIVSGDSCDTVAQKNSISVAQLRSWNTEINASCSNLWLDYYVCTGIPGAVSPPTTTTTAPAPSNSPQLPGSASNCNKWYKIVSGDTCDNMAAKNKITVPQLRTWNPHINANCNNLFLNYFACVSIPGAATPMPGIVANCSRFTLVASGDSCEAIAQRTGITVANFRRWNTEINASCSNLWANALVCTGA